MIKTIIESVPLKLQRFITLGDYYFKKGVRYFRITKTKNDLYDDIIFLHEFVEEITTRAKGIKEKEIMKHDLWFEGEVKKGNFPDDAEPGEHKNAPYRRQHLFAEKIERMVIKELNIDWKEYSDYLNKLL